MDEHSMTEPEGKKRRKPTSNVQRSLKHMRDLGWTCAIVERWNPHAFVRQDLFGGIDIVCIGGAPLPLHSFTTRNGQECKVSLGGRQGVLGLQCCSDNGGSVADHTAKLLALPALRLWVECGNRLVIHGWGLRAMPREPGAPKKGKRRKVWTLREVEITLADFDAQMQSEAQVNA